MIPRILEYEDGRVKVTAEAFAIPEIKIIIDKYDMQAEPYLSYIYSMSAPDSPYINIPVNERIELVIYDTKATLGDFDWEDSILQNAIDKLRSLYVSPIVAIAEELGDELHRIITQLRNTPIVMGGMEDNMKIRMALLERIGKISGEYTKVREQADKEIKASTKGGHEIGGYLND